MGFALLWIESLVASLLLVATVTACAGRVRRGWRQLALALPVPLVMILGHLAMVGSVIYYQYRFPINACFYPIATLAVIILVGTVWLMVRGLRRDDAGGTVAAGWPRDKLAIALVAALALCCMTYWNLDLAARQQYAALRVEAGALALSVTPPPIPDRDNAAEIYQQAFEAMGRRHKEDTSSPSAWQWDDAWTKAWDKQWSKWDLAAVESGKLDKELHDPELRRFMERQEPALRLLRKAASMPGCRFERVYVQPDLTQPLPVRSMLTASQLLTLDTIYSAANGNRQRTVADINAAFRMAEHFGSHPWLMPVLVAAVTDALAVQSLQAALALYPNPPNDVAAVKISDSMSYHALFARAWRYEAAASMLPPAYGYFLLVDDSAARRRYSAELDEAAQLPYWQVKDRLRDLDQRAEHNPIGMIPWTSIGAIMEKGTKAEARRDAARLGLALYAYRARNGKFPAKLDDLAPEFIESVPLNPYDGEPMKVQRTERGMTIYSVGPLQAGPHGGFSDGDKGDITFTVPDVGGGKGTK